MRGTEADTLWRAEDGSRQRTGSGEVYMGSILEHLLIQHLTAFYEVGSHNIFRLRGADWNDALDMAAENGESVAFTCAYAGNFRQLAQLLRRLAEELETVNIPGELLELLTDTHGSFDDIEKKNSLLERYARRCQHSVSGMTVPVSIQDLANNMDRRAERLMEHIRSQEWIDAGEDGGWFNSYYDNNCRRVEGITGTGVRMMLTGQVFAIMSGTATDEQVKSITRSADRYLYRKEIGGYRLNTDFHELKFDMGRMFGFAYGEKENGAVFSRMAVMYANALYRRGFAREGYKALQSLAGAALDFETSRIYPGIPEYFNSDGRGVYHYLTGAASWYMMTMITEVFGVRGENGDLVICPRLVREQFDQAGNASVTLPFAGKTFQVTFSNRSGKDYGEYRMEKACLTSAGSQHLHVADGRAVLERSELLWLPGGKHQITVELV